MANSPLHSPINPHFFQPLLPGFTNHLDIPVAFFLKHLERNNKRKTAKLRSDASETTWRVEIDGQRLSDGWEDFAVGHDLRLGDTVIFRHEGELVFHVTALGPSCSEIQYGGYSDEEEDKKEKVSRKKKSPKAETDPSTDQSFFMTTVTASNLKRDIVYLPKTFAMSNGLLKRFEIPSDECDTRQGLEATEKEFLGVETNRNDTSQSKEAIKIRTRSKATIKEENITTSQNRFVTLTATPTAHSTQFPLWARKSSVGVHEREWNQQRREDNDEGQVRYKMVDGFCEVNDVKMGESFVLELVWENTVSGS
ncbi:hypothetical protein HID58_062208 [Brassica napus]|uniref:TF-B3 domain-containing protein n=1 Tax=Brassica napus TaxID=3708 RepID=A0ABQ8A0T3_BRANA|nr:hypothetical protein HID58_062208 [Brassica napus]